MRNMMIGLIALALIAPVAIAHTPPGPKNFCESSNDWSEHDFVAGNGHLLWGSPLQDGNLLGDCNGDTVPGDYDGHLEFAVGGGYLAAANGGVYASGPWLGASWGSVACLGENADHTPATEVSVSATGTGGAVGFSVTSDYARDAVPADTDPQTGAQTICGDHLIEPCDPTSPTDVDQVTCNAKDGELIVPPAALGSLSNAGTPTFGPGQNGAYVVFIDIWVNATAPGVGVSGHIHM